MSKKCIACGGTGTASSGYLCSPCKGTGVKDGRLDTINEVEEEEEEEEEEEREELPPIVFDVETDLIRPGKIVPDLICMSVEDDGDVYLLNRDDSLECFDEMLSSGRRLVGHNVAFDLSVFAKEEPSFLPRIYEAYEDDRVTDTMLRQKLIDIAEGKYRGFIRIDGKTVKVSYGLDALCLRLLGFELPKTEIRLQFNELRNTPLEEWPQLAKDYAMSDAAVTSEIFEVQAKKYEFLMDEYRQAAAAWWIQLMGAWGLRTDPKGVKEFAEELQRDFNKRFAVLQKAGLMRPDGTRDTKAAQARMEKVCKEKELGLILTPKGGISLSADHCEATEDDVLKAYAEISSLKKQLSTDIPLLQKGTRLPIHPRFESLVASGRTASSPNVQNLPVYGKMRECFVPSKGYVYASADFDGFELRTMAQVCVSRFGKSKLGDALNEGLDPHLVMASQILRISYEEAQRRRAEDDDEVYRARQTGKVANFGFPGGLGATRLVMWAKKVYDVDITEDAARKLKENWLKAWPEFQDFFNNIGALCEQASPKLIQLKSGRFRGDITFTEACNSEFQGLAADAAKLAGFLVSKACYAEPDSPLYGSRIVNFVHDEFILESPEDTAPEAAEELARLMVKGASAFLPDVHPKASPMLMRRWSKKAKELRDKTGRLVPWAA